MLVENRDEKSRKELDDMLNRRPASAAVEIDPDTGLDMANAPSWWKGEEEAIVEARQAQAWMRNVAR